MVTGASVADDARLGWGNTARQPMLGESVARFPDDFVWGAATSAYQIEGAAFDDGKGPSIWDTFSHEPGRVHHGDTGDVACDHYHHLDEDLDLMADLGIGSYRFSLSWPRVQPEGRGAVNHEGMDFYGRLVDGLLDRGITPALTLHHWDLPQALQDLGGWQERETAERFADFATLVAERLGDRVPVWMTLNEPWVIAWLGYGAGLFAPGVADLDAALVAHHHLLVAHARSLEILRSATAPGTSVGIALNMMHMYPATDHPDDVTAARQADGQFNRSFTEPLVAGRYPEDLAAYAHVWNDPAIVHDGDLDAASAPIDFLGVNCYSPRTVVAPHRVAELRDQGLWGQHDPVMAFGLDIAEVQPYGAATTSMGWPIVPEGLRDLLVRMSHDYAVPLVITENGAAFDDYADPDGRINDTERVAYLDSHLRAVHDAIAAGADVRGYYVWSLFDNFEWAAGYSKRFGIVHVDFPTARRTPKASYAWYRDVVTSNRLGSRGADQAVAAASTSDPDPARSE